MIIRYTDKNGGEHRLNIDSNKRRPIFIASEIENTGEYTEYCVKEILKFCPGENNKPSGFKPSGTIQISAASDKGMAIVANGSRTIKICPEF